MSLYQNILFSYEQKQQTFLCFGIFPSASSFALACLRLIILWYCLAFTYSGSSRVSMATGIRCVAMGWKLRQMYIENLDEGLFSPLISEIIWS